MSQELDLDFGQAGNPMDDFVRQVRVDGETVPDFNGPIRLVHPTDTLALINGDSLGGAKPAAVFFDSIMGRSASLAVRHGHLY